MDTQYIFGIRAILEAISAGRIIDKVVAKKGLQGDLYKELKDACARNKIRMQFSDVEVLDRITKSNHQGVIAFLTAIEYQNIEEVIPGIIGRGEQPFIVVLDGITDVRNFGAIARSAECAGAHAIIIAEKGAAPINGEAVKTSAGALHRLPICVVKNMFYTLKYLQTQGIKIVAVTEKGATPYYETKLDGPVALILGAEDKGINPQNMKLAEVNTLIPLKGNIESLNVSVAAGILFFEIVRQRG
jgi:23S rRNA (guanosine2251-2'-O)-methyltransferase